MTLREISLSILGYAITGIAAFAGAWLAARFALHRYYHERLWDRRADAYSAIFEALHDMSQWYDTHMNAAMRYQDIPEDKATKLLEEHKTVERILNRRLAKETWLISDQSRLLIEELQKKMKNSDFDRWYDYLENGSYGIFETIIKLRQFVREEIVPPPLGLLDLKSVASAVTSRLRLKKP